MSDDDRRRHGKVLVTGSSSGIGRALTELLLARGTGVIGVARDHGKFRPRDDGYVPVSLDLAEIEQLSAAQIRRAIDLNLTSHLLVARAGVRVTLVSPGPVRTPFFDPLDFEPDTGSDHALLPEDVARVMIDVLDAPRHVVFDEIALGPRHRSMRRK
jgi:NADP-dependent 3-hydroxy acid dehydrogenase YdfG